MFKPQTPSKAKPSPDSQESNIQKKRRMLDLEESKSANKLQDWELT
jgi:hypothetical protein